MGADENSSNEEPFQASLQEDYEDDAAWDAVAALRRRGTEEVFQLAIRYCKSGVALERARGLDVLGQLGAGKPMSERPRFDDCLAIAIEHLRDEDATVIHSSAWALSHLTSEKAISALIEMRANSDSGVRWAVAAGMMGSHREDAIATLIELMDDVDDNVRDWATFELGTQCDVDSPVIRDALRERLADKYQEAQSEAIWGLAKRKDQEGLTILIDRLGADEWITGDEMAAGEILGLPSDTPADELREGLKKLLPDYLPR